MSISRASGINRFLRSWVAGVVSAAPWVTFIAALLTAGILVYTVNTLSVNTDTTDMIARDLPYRVVYDDFKAAFPHNVKAVVAVIDGTSPEAAMAASEALAKALEGHRLITSVFRPGGGPYFERNGLMYLKVDDLHRLSADLARAQPLLGTLAAAPGLAGLSDALASAADNFKAGPGEAETLARAYRAIAEVIEARLASRPKPLSWWSLVAPDTETGGHTRRLLLIKPRLDYSRLSAATPAIAAIRAAARGLLPALRDQVIIRLTGPAALAQEELGSAARGATRAGIISLVLVTGLLVIGLRRIWLAVATFLTLIMGLIWSAGFAALAVGELNLISVAFAALFIGLGVDFGLHFTLRYLEVLDGGVDRAAALSQAAGHVGPALALCAIAAAIGFYSFVPTDFAGLAQLGLISGSSMFIAFAMSLTLLPALLAIGPKAKGFRRPAVRWVALELMVRERAGLVVAVAALLAIAAGAAIPFARFDFDPLNLKDPTVESVRTLRDLAADGDFAVTTVEIIARDLAGAKVLATKLDALPEVGQVITAASFIPGRQGEKLAIIDNMALFMGPVLAPPQGPPKALDRAQTTAAISKLRQSLTRLTQRTEIPALKRATATLERTVTRLGRSGAVLQQATMGDLFAWFPRLIVRLSASLEARPVTLRNIPEPLRRRWITDDGRARVLVKPATSLLGNADAQKRFVTAVSAIAPQATGPAVVIQRAGQAVVRAFYQAGLMTLAGITLLVWLVLRRTRDILLVLSPLILAALLTTAVAVVLGIFFNFANIIVLPLLFGLGVASSVHLVMRFRSEDPDRPLVETSTPRAVLFSALTTIASFGTLGLSPHQGTASMGQLLMIAIFLTLACTIIVLPALIALLGRPGGSRLFTFPRFGRHAAGAEGESVLEHQETDRSAGRNSGGG